MSTPRHDEALHPRETTGKFAAKPTSEVAGGLDTLAASDPDVGMDAEGQNVPVQETWTFFGHWADDDSLVIDSWVCGEQEDERDDDGKWAGGPWSDSGTGFNKDEALAEAAGAYI